NFQLEIQLDEGARLELMEVQNLGEHVSYISREYAHVHRDAHLNWTYVALGSRVAKSFITVDLLGPGSETLMNGAYFSGSGQVIDLDTQQNHLTAQAHSDLLYKGAAIGSGKAIWEGMIYVDHVAQQTDSYQSNRNLLLDDHAEIKTIPGLEINANDVSCSHGATVGRLNDDELFYSQSRGIPMREAEKLIVEGFFAEVLAKSNDEALSKKLLEQISEKFDRNHA
ncbi:MAG TPA: SufD family Fe-S cluster assembly protein, partial [Anaerolineaceae bacterium]|nr:SufD family Fe-S cluster assembly protein [Anaerolineaceae bacterium]